MNWMNDMEDPLFENLLSDYVADTPDDGFSARMLEHLEAQEAREARIRRFMLSAAFLAGGLIAGLQVKNLFVWASQTTVIADAAGSTMFPAIIGLTFLFGVWMSLESRSVSFSL